MFDHRSDATVRKDVPHSRRSVSPAPAFGLIPAAVVACLVLLIGMVAAPPGYVARASFVVDWNSLRSGQGSEMAEKMRNNYQATFIAEVTSLPDSESELSEVLDRAGDFSGSPADKAALISRLQKQLQVSLTGQTDNGDQFTIEARDDDPGAARAAANRVLQGTVSRLKAEAGTGGTSVAWRSLAEAGLNSRSNFEQILVANPIKVINEARVERRGVRYAFGVLLAAVVFGGTAGSLALLLRQLVLAVTALKSVAGGVSRRTRTQSSANAGSRRRRLTQTPQRPILLRPLPQMCIAESLQEADGLSGLRE